MKIKAILLFIVVFIVSSLALADTPPPWSEFETKSANGLYSAEVRAKDKTKGIKPWEWSYKLTVFEAEATLKTVIWSCDYDYDGYPGGILSDDGSTFVNVDEWYFNDRPVILIYRKGKKVGVLCGKDFNIEESKLKKTVSHELWLNENGSPPRFVSVENLPLALEIVTIDNNKHIIDVESGAILNLVIGSFLDTGYTSNRTIGLCMTSSAQFDPCVDILLDNIRYKVAYDRDNRKISYIYTNDKNFRTVDDLCVGKYVNVSKKEIVYYPGWVVYGPESKDGWNPVIGWGLDGSKITILKDGQDVSVDLKDLNESAVLEVKIIGFSKK